MPTKTKPQAATQPEAFCAFSLLTEWARQGSESFFATQRILWDLVMRQNATTMTAVREQLATVRTAPVAALTELVGEGVSNLIAVDRVLLQLAQRENEILVGAVQDRTGNYAPAAALTNVIRRSIDTFVDMQLHFLTMAAKQADLWADAAKTGKPFGGKALPELARDSVENFVRAQKKYLDVIAEETANLTNGVTNGHNGKRTEIAELAREATEAFIDAQKKVLDVYAQQGDAGMKAARGAFEALNMFQPATVKEFSRETVENFVSAEKALLELVAKPMRSASHDEHHAPKKGSQRKRTAKHEPVPVGA
jgi:hypothetical protein